MICMTMTRRASIAAVLLAVGAGLVLLGLLVHYGFMAMYGKVADSAFQGLVWGLTAGLSGIVLGAVVVVALVAVVLSPRWWMRLLAVALPVVMFLGMLALTPLALGQKVATQYDSIPQCLTPGSGEPAATAERESQRAFESMEHIGYFSGGGASGMGGCDRFLEVSEEVDVLQHYRGALPAAGWDVIEDDGRHLRAQRDRMAFEVIACPGGGIVWAGGVNEDFSARCAP